MSEIPLNNCPNCGSDMLQQIPGWWRCISCGKSSSGIDTEPGLNSLNLKVEDKKYSYSRFIVPGVLFDKIAVSVKS